MTGLITFLIVALSAATVYAADIDAGKAQFTKCMICHTIIANAPSTVGPNLHGIFGRKAGTLPGFAYSAALKNSGVTWDDKTLAAFIHDPKADLPGNRMAFPGLKNDGDIANLLAYLQQATQ